MRGLHFVTIVPPGPHGHVLFGIDDTHPEHDEIGFSLTFTRKLSPLSVATAIGRSALIRPVLKPAAPVRVQTRTGIAVVSPTAKPLTASAFVVPRTGVSAIAAVGMADRLIDAAKKAKPGNAANVARVAVPGIYPNVAVAAAAHAQQIATQVKTNPVAAGAQVAAVSKLASSGHPQSQATVAVLKAAGQAQAAKNIVTATMALAANGDADANRALGIVKARANQRAEGRRFTFTLTPDGRIHHEPESTLGDDPIAPVRALPEHIFGDGDLFGWGTNASLQDLLG